MPLLSPLMIFVIFKEIGKINILPKTNIKGTLNDLRFKKLELEMIKPKLMAISISRIYLQKKDKNFLCMRSLVS
jgi:hypothetical protein